jgi:hypothetical protein
MAVASSHDSWEAGRDCRIRSRAAAAILEGRMERIRPGGGKRPPPVLDELASFMSA